MVRLSEYRGRRHVVMMTGAVTSPMCAFEVPAFNQLQQEFEKEEISFFLLYTRESHPAENYAAHSSFEQKLSYARDLRRLEDIRFPIIVDYLDGRIHRAYGVWPNALFVIHKDGRLIFRSNMASGRELQQYLEALLSAERAAAEGKVTHLQYSERVLPHVADQVTHRRVYQRAGPKAFEDYWAKRPQNRNRWP
jgi:alkyl hydroperoxide reductase subunit AhpC